MNLEHIWPVILIGALIVIGVIWLISRSEDNHGGNREEGGGGAKPEGRPSVKQAKHEQEAEQLRRQAAAKLERDKREAAEKYCRIRENIAKCEGDEAYKECFFRMVPLYQSLLGSARGRDREEFSDSIMLGEMDTALKNAGLHQKFLTTGFAVKADAPRVDRDVLISKCMAADLTDILRQINQETKLLEHYRNTLNWEEILNQTEDPIREIIEAVRRDDARTCRKAVSRIDAVLKRFNCHAVFADDPVVARSEAMRTDFRDENPGATELPALYMRDCAGAYHRIGAYTGTRRRSK